MADVSNPIHPAFPSHPLPKTRPAPDNLPRLFPIRHNQLGSPLPPLRALIHSSLLNRGWHLPRHSHPHSLLLALESFP
jgi:hypothetical protein